jgi:nitrogen fixation protein FixH
MKTLSPELQRRERTAIFMWTSLILMFFLLQAILWTVAISITSRDASHAVVAGYDEQALHWDEVKNLRQESVALGWDAELLVDATGDIRGNRVVTLCLKDKNKTPLEHLKIEINAYHRGRAAEKQNLTLKPVGPGIYSTTVLVRNSGQWQFTGTAKSNDQQFLIEQQIALDSNRNL